MKAKDFEELHNVGYNAGPYYKRMWKHLFPENDKHNYDNASLYLTYVLKLRSLVADVMVDKQPKDIYEFFGGDNKPETCYQFIQRLYMQQERNSIRATVISRHERILDKFNVPYEHLKPKFKGLDNEKMVSSVLH